jgi:hypothetical protein
VNIPVEAKSEETVSHLPSLSLSFFLSHVFFAFFFLFLATKAAKWNETSDENSENESRKREDEG